jgi:hypothetical protein
LVRTNAGPLPGLTCWNSITVQSEPSISRHMPFLRSLVVATLRLSYMRDEAQIFSHRSSVDETLGYLILVRILKSVPA